MCEPTDGGACGCSTTTTTRPAPTRRTCATEGCDRIASGGALNCRTCRAEAPIRRELAQREAAHRREVQAYREALGTVKRTLFEATGAETISAKHAARLAAKDIASKEAAIEVLDRKCGILRMDRDARAKHINQGEADAIGQMLGCEPVGRSIVAAVARWDEQATHLRTQLDTETRDRRDWESVALDNAMDRDTARDEARAAEAKVAGLVAEVDDLRLQVRIASGLAALAGVALVAIGLLRGAAMVGDGL